VKALRPTTCVTFRASQPSLSIPTETTHRSPVVLGARVVFAFSLQLADAVRRLAQALGHLLPGLGSTRCPASTRSFVSMRKVTLPLRSLFSSSREEGSPGDVFGPA